MRQIWRRWPRRSRLTWKIGTSEMAKTLSGGDRRAVVTSFKDMVGCKV